MVLMNSKRLVQRAARAWLALMLMLGVGLTGAAFAHKHGKHGEEHHAEQTSPMQTSSTGSQGASGSASSSSPSASASELHEADHGMMGDMNMEADRSKLPFFERLYEWLGRLHPVIVHFPIAFFPAALLTAVVGRRRPAFAAPVQFLVIAGGVFAPIAAMAGWLTGMTADPDPILTYHRWLGVAVGVGGAALGVWAWRRPFEDRGAGMILGLAAITAAIAIQGFLGATITHGWDHLMF